ncbi:DUF6492 family protein [Nakamurella sp. GG22]
MPATLSFVTVVFESEYLLLDLQARSMSVYLPASMVGEIIVIDNSRRGMSKEFKHRLTTSYGDLKARVSFVRPKDICTVPATTGWRSQQVYKLVIAERISGERYVVLDAKNHFVAEARPHFFQSPDGRARVNEYSFRTHPLRPALENVLGYLGLDPAPAIEKFPATVTPFVLDTALVRAMMQDIEERSGNDFATEFVDNNLLEFFLYSGWLLRSGRSLDQVFDFHQVLCPNIWVKNVGPDVVRGAIAKAADRELPLFSIHRKALGRLDAQSVRLLVDFWTERGLFDSVDAGSRFVADFTTAFRRAELIRKVRESPVRVAKKLDRSRSQLLQRWEARRGKHGQGEI